MNNRIMGFSGMTRKGVVSSHLCAILTSDKEERGERHDRYGRSIANTRRGGGYAPSQTAYGSEVHRQWHIGSCQSRGTLASKAGGCRALLSQKHQTGKPEINKATGRWQRKIKQFTAVRPFPTAWNPLGNSPCKHLPIFIIRTLPNKVKVLYKIWAHERRCAHE